MFANDANFTVLVSSDRGSNIYIYIYRLESMRVQRAHRFDNRTTDVEVCTNLSFTRDSIGVPSLLDSIRNSKIFYDNRVVANRLIQIIQNYLFGQSWARYSTDLYIAIDYLPVIRVSTIELLYFSRFNDRE